MNLEELVGQTFQENQLYELLHFDIEQDLKKYHSKFVHLYFDHLEDGLIRINKIVYLTSQKEIYADNRRIVGQTGWIEIYHHCNHIDLMICRKNTSGKFSVIGPNINHVQIFRHNNYDLPTRTTPLTPDERREAFAELAGVLEDHSKISKPKKAV